MLAARTFLAYGLRRLITYVFQNRLDRPYFEVEHTQRACRKGSETCRELMHWSRDQAQHRRQTDMFERFCNVGGGVGHIASPLEGGRGRQRADILGDRSV